MKNGDRRSSAAVMLRGTGACALLAVAVVSCDGQVLPPSASSSLPAGVTVSHNVGPVSIANGPIEVDHTFEVRNDASHVRRVSGVRTTCQCAQAALDIQEIQPGAVAMLRVTVEVSTTGQVAQGASLLWSDGIVDNFIIRAWGTLPDELRVIPLSRVNERSRKAQVRVYRIDTSKKHDIAEAPTLIEPERVSARLREWVLLEDGVRIPTRPTRQVGTYNS